MKDYRTIYESKIISIPEAIEKIQNGDVVGVGGPSNQPSSILEKLHYLKNYGRENVTIFHLSGQVRGTFQYYTDPSMKGTLRVHACFYNKLSMDVQKHGVVSLVPYPVYRAHKPAPINVFITSCSRPDKNGYVYMSLGALGEGPAWRQADRIILEVNENFPRTYGDVSIPIERVNWFVIGSGEMINYPEIELSETEKKIGQYVASLVEDGSTVQLGVGGIPNAVAKEFYTKNDLGVHSEMITTNMARLAEEGVITGRRKTINKDKMIGSFAMGTQELYDFLDGNPAVEIRSGNYVNNPCVISQNYKMVSINTALQIDLAGQVCSESFGPIQYSGIGGAMDFAQGAHYAKDGKAIVAIKSTAKGGTVSTIQAILTPGSIVTIPRSMVDYFVTEYGIAKMSLCSMQERVENLINISHPKFRDELRQQAIDLKITAW